MHAILEEVCSEYEVAVFGVGYVIAIIAVDHTCAFIVEVDYGNFFE